MKNLHGREEAVDARPSPGVLNAFYDIAGRFQSEVMRPRQGSASDLSSTAF